MGIATEVVIEAPPAVALDEPRVPLRRRLFDSTALNSFLALADQGVVSAARFFTTVMVGRMCGPGELGNYSLVFSYIFFLACAQEALLSVPYTIYGNRLHGDARRQYAGGVLVQYFLMSVAAMIILAAVAVVLSLGIGPSGLAPVTWLMAGMIPFMMLREFGRQQAFAHLKMATALAIDFFASAILVAGLVLLAYFGALSALTAYTVMGIGCAVAGIAWLIGARDRFLVRKGQIRAVLQRNWLLGRWVLSAQMALAVRGYTIPWLLALTLGTGATGLFAACESIVLLTNPFLLGVGSILTPYVARGYANGGPREARRVAAKATVVLVLVTAGLSGMIVLLSNPLMRIFFGEEYLGQHYTIALLALAVLADASSMAAHSGLCAIERPQLSFVASLTGVLVLLAASAVLVGSWGIMGAVCGLLVGNIVTSTIRCVAFFGWAGSARGGCA